MKYSHYLFFMTVSAHVEISKGIRSTILKKIIKVQKHVVVNFDITVFNYVFK